MGMVISMRLKSEICKAFDAQAKHYDHAALVQLEIGNRLFERLQYIKLSPRYVLDLGCGTGMVSRQLKQQYPNATIVGFDLAHAMLTEAKTKQTWRKKWALVQGDMMALPFADGLFDLVFANQSIHWSEEMPELMRELNRVMRPEACLLFSTVGPDTLKELKQAWAAVDSCVHVNHFLDMHDLGDILLAEQFLDPVVDMEMLTVHYPSLTKLLQALKMQGVRNIHPQRRLGLTGKKQWLRFESTIKANCTKEGKFPLSYEVIYGQAWKGEQRLTERGMEVMIPVTSIKRK